MKTGFRKVYIGKSKIHNKGVFAFRNFKKGEITLIFKGKIVHWEVHNQKSSLYGPNWIGIGKNKWMDVCSPGVYLNHSCNPNCGIKGRVEVVALKEIKKDEEITIDYSITEIDKLWFMKCSCGSKNCRKIIHSIQSLPKKQLKKYLPYVPTYFRDLYLKNYGRRLNYENSNKKNLCWAEQNTQ